MSEYFIFLLMMRNLSHTMSLGFNFFPLFLAGGFLLLFFILILSNRSRSSQNTKTIEGSNSTFKPNSINEAQSTEKPVKEDPNNQINDLAKNSTNNKNFIKSLNEDLQTNNEINYCPSCGGKIERKIVKFCPYCGEKIQV